jgi:hypothetical protein
MEPLPLVDVHRMSVRATAERTWDAVTRFAGRRLGRPAPCSRASERSR